MHGDFHEGNILFDARGEICLIDFDYSRENDIQAYDAFYYIFEKERVNTGDSWLVFWKKIHRRERYLLDKYNDIFKEIIDMSFEEIMIIFFLERLGGEYLHNYIVNKSEVLEDVTEILLW